jgi:hypothetical protein
MTVSGPPEGKNAQVRDVRRQGLEPRTRGLRANKEPCQPRDGPSP